MAAQAEVESKQLKVLAEKTNVMSEFAQALIDAVDEHARTTFKRAQTVAIEREEQSQAQETILKAISKMAGQQRPKLDSQFTRQLSNELQKQLSIELEG